MSGTWHNENVMGTLLLSPYSHILYFLEPPTKIDKMQIAKPMTKNDVATVATNRICVPPGSNRIARIIQKSDKNINTMPTSIHILFPDRERLRKLKYTI